MSVKQRKKLSFADLANNQNNRTRLKLQQIHQMINWRPIERMLAQYYTKGQNNVGRSAYPPIVLFKACLLQTWYALSDYQIEDEMQDRSSFQ